MKKYNGQNVECQGSHHSSTKSAGNLQRLRELMRSHKRRNTVNLGHVQHN